ncbi:MAG: hypothetical protein WBE32_06900 [Pseudolabrys sp.]|jgi:hypothetical protein
MTRLAVLAAALSLTLASCVGVYGPKGNDIGGIIPWSPEAEANALNIAQNNCARFNKYALITSIHRMYGDYIAYECWWSPPPRMRRRIN